ncbi:MAG: hypothetical protein ACOYLB_14105 [Phototrophicaceae bacterium]
MNNYDFQQIIQSAILQVYLEERQNPTDHLDSAFNNQNYRARWETFRSYVYNTLPPEELTVDPEQLEQILRFVFCTEVIKVDPERVQYILF